MVATILTSGPRSVAGRKPRSHHVAKRPKIFDSYLPWHRETMQKAPTSANAMV